MTVCQIARCHDPAVAILTLKLNDCINPEHNHGTGQAIQFIYCAEHIGGTAGNHASHHAMTIRPLS